MKDFEKKEQQPIENTEVITPSHEMDMLKQKLSEDIDFEKLMEICEQLQDAIQEILQSCGLYFRIFSRVKSADSIAKKLQRGKYGTAENPKKIQDLIGLRVVLYYYDDISICREIMESTFLMIGEWSKARFKTNEFKATKTNGVFRFPLEYFKLYKKDLWSFPIDTTFELQFRTVFFEGWHEIEHDMRYKSMLTDQEFWKGSEELSRVLNCILANLELSDWSLVKLFDELSYNHYKSRNWDLMLKSRYRIHLNNEEPLSQEIIDLFNQDIPLAKRFFKASRRTLIKELLKQDHPQINYNLIIKLLNDREIKNQQVTEIFNHMTHVIFGKAHPKNTLARLETDILFHIKLPLLHKEIRNLDTEFYNAASILYKWARFKLNPVFEDIPAELAAYQGKLPGYEINITYEPEKLSFVMQLEHIDCHSIGTLWHVYASIQLSEDGKLLFYHITSRDMPRGVSHRSTFNRPSYLTDLSNKIGLVDVVRLGSKAKMVDDDETLDELIHLIRSGDRRLPVVVITQNSLEAPDSISENEDWDYDMNTFTINGTRFAKVTGLYCHVYMTDFTWNHSFADAFSIDRNDVQGCIAIFWPESRQKSFELYTRQMVNNAQFDFNRFAFHEDSLCEKAFRHKLVQMIKDDHVAYSGRT